MGKYDTWEGFFQALEGDRHEIPLEALEEMVDGNLPASAIHEKAWWSGDHYYAAWLKAGWYASLQPADGTVILSRTPFRRGRPAKEKPARVFTQPSSQVTLPTVDRLVVVGCVAQKHHTARPAKELYNSPLWQKRRRYAEATGMPWFILSAEHGLLDPEQVVEPYDRYMERETRAYRQEWSNAVSTALLEECRLRGLKAVEAHAGAAYLEHGLISMLQGHAVEVLWPLKGQPIGKQLQWYDDVAGSATERFSSADPSVMTARPDLVAPSPDHATGVAAVYLSGALGESWSDLPEVEYLPVDASPVDRRLWLTFVASVDRARDAASLWRAANKVWASDRWVFQPEEVVNRTFTELMETLRLHKLSQRHRQDSASWRSIAEALHSSQCPPAIRGAIDGNATSAADLLRSLGATWPHGTPMFPQLSGPKIGPMWIRILAYPGGVAISQMDLIPVAVDTHVQRVTEMLGLVRPRMLDDRHRDSIQQLWFESVAQAGAFGAPEGIDGTAAGLDPALWVLGKVGCSRCERISQKAPVGPICDLCVLGRV